MAGKPAPTVDQAVRQFVGDTLISLAYGQRETALGGRKALQAGIQRALDMRAVLNNALTQFRDVEGVEASTVDSLKELRENLRLHSRQLVRAMGAQTQGREAHHIEVSQSMYNTFLAGAIALTDGADGPPTPASHELDRDQLS